MQKRQISENVAGTLPRAGRASGVEKCRCQQERLFQLYPPNELTSTVRPVVGSVCGIWLAAGYNPQMDPGAVRHGLQCGRAGSGRRPEDFPGPLFGSRQRLDNGYRRSVDLQVSDTFKKYPNIPTTLAGASLGADSPDFTLP